MDGYELARIRTAFVNHARVDIKLEIVEEVGGHLRQARWTVSVDARGNARDPRVVKEWTELEIVIGVMMRDEDVAETVQRDAGGYQLSGCAVAAVDKVRHVFNQNQCRRITAVGFADSWPTFRAEQNDARACLLLVQRDFRQQRTRNRETAGGA